MTRRARLTNNVQRVGPAGFDTYPVDLTSHCDFVNDTRWKPYFGGGMRYVAAPNVDPRFRYQVHFGIDVVGGTASFGLVLDGKLYFGDYEAYDQPFKASIGLLWKF